VSFPSLTSRQCMADKSIFHKVVRREPGYTQLLVNLMKRYPDFRNAVLAALLNPAVSNTVLPHEIEADINAEQGCRPDIIIHSNDLLAYIEVKIRHNCQMTDNQICEDLTDSSKSGYVQNLRASPARHRWMVFLVPAGWSHRIQAEEFLQHVKTLTTSINTRLVSWEDVLQIVQRFASDPIIREFHQVLLEQFGPITFTEEEVSMLTSETFAPAFRGVRKLESTIDAVETEVTKSGFATERERDEETYGFYVMRGRNYLLWFGVWLEVTDQKGGELFVAVQKNSRKVPPEIAQRFEAVCKDMNPFDVSTETGTWTVVTVRSDILRSDDPVRQISDYTVRIANALGS
jgi:hypothetical protein